MLLIFYIFVPVRVESGEEKTRLAYLYERKEVIYENLRDLSFEYKAGKLGDADFQGLRNSMEEDAAAVLAEIDQLEKAASELRASSRSSGEKRGARVKRILLLSFIFFCLVRVPSRFGAGHHRSCHQWHHRQTGCRN